MVADVLVVGCGLIGTSIGLALREGPWGDVVLSDADEQALARALERGAGRRWDGAERVSLAVVAVPPQRTAEVLLTLQRRDVALTYTHVASVQAQVQNEVESSSSDASRIVGGHPLAGRELSGPGAALSDLFVGRPWAVCAGPSSAPDALEAVMTLARECGASPQPIEAAAHDRAVAYSSHLPQVAASALAAVLAGGAAAAVDLSLAGPGLADTTRLAAGDPELWTSILTANATQVAGPVRFMADVLLEAADALDGLARGQDDEAAARVRRLVEAGNRGRARVPLKRGVVEGAFEGVRVDVADEPGQLAALLTCAGDAGLNVEDVRVEHVPGRPRGVIELLVAAPERDRMRAVLGAAGWHVLSA